MDRFRSTQRTGRRATRPVLLAALLVLSTSARAEAPLHLEWTDRADPSPPGVVQLFDRELHCKADGSCALWTVDFRVECPGAEGHVRPSSTFDGSLRVTRPSWDRIEIEWSDARSVTQLVLDLVGDERRPWVAQVSGSTAPAARGTITRLVGFDPPEGALPGIQSQVRLDLGCTSADVTTTAAPNG